MATLEWQENGDLKAENITLRRVAWLVNGGPMDKKIITDMDELKGEDGKRVAVGSFSPLYIEVGD